WLGAGGAAPGRRNAGERSDLSARLEVSDWLSAPGWFVVCSLAQQAVPDVLRDRLPARQGPVHLQRRERLGGHRPGARLRARTGEVGAEIVWDKFPTCLIQADKLETCPTLTKRYAIQVVRAAAMRGQK